VTEVRKWTTPRIFGTTEDPVGRVYR